jgi:hypothetical protein
VDVIHAIRVRLIPVLTGVDPYELTLGSHITSSKQKWCHEGQKELIHIEYFLVDLLVGYARNVLKVPFIIGILD